MSRNVHQKPLNMLYSKYYSCIMFILLKKIIFDITFIEIIQIIITAVVLTVEHIECM